MVEYRLESNEIVTVTLEMVTSSFTFYIHFPGIYTKYGLLLTQGKMLA